MRLGAARWLSNPERRSKFGILGLSELDTQFARFASRSFRCDERLLEHRKDPPGDRLVSEVELRAGLATRKALIGWMRTGLQSRLYMTLLLTRWPHPMLAPLPVCR